MKKNFIPENPNDSNGMKLADFTKVILSLTAWISIAFGIILALTDRYSTFFSEESIHSPDPMNYFIDGKGLIIIGILLFIINWRKEKN